MKTRAHVLLTTLIAFVGTCAVEGQGTAFTYQGRLNVGTNPADGIYDFQFALYTAATSGTEIGAAITKTGQTLSNGLFTVTLDFGAGIFTGTSNWLQIGARTNGASTFTSLSPRQPITPTPYAIFAEGANAANLSGGVSDANLSANVALRAGGNSFSGDQGLASSATYEFGQGDTKQTDAGKIGYETFSGTALDIVGAGLNATSRQIMLWAEGGTTLTGPLVLNGSELMNFNFSAGNQQLWVTESARSQAAPTNVAVRIVPYNNQNVGYIDAISTDSSLTKSLVFNPNGGNVGIGTIDPLTALQLGDYGNGNEFLSIKSAGGNLYETGIQLRHFNNTDGFDITDSEVLTNYGLNFVSYPYGGTPFTAMFIARNTGNVGIGTLSPQTTLQVGDFGTGNQFFSIVSAGGNLYQTGIQFRHFNQTDGFNITDSELVTNNGLNFVRYPYNGTSTATPATAMYIDRGSGYVGIGTVTPSTALDVAGEITCTVMNITSDRNAKEKFQPVNPRKVLDKVARLPITEWQYKTQEGARHIGPMAQDFHDAFALGHDDKHITSVDEDGVALAAIQGLNEKVNEMKSAISSRDRENAQLKQEVGELKQVVEEIERKMLDKKPQ
jgi:hypothetical protein